MKKSYRLFRLTTSGIDVCRTFSINGFHLTFQQHSLPYSRFAANSMFEYIECYGLFILCDILANIELYTYYTESPVFFLRR